MGEIKVSVVMPTYNQAQYITSAIESVLRQSFEHFELIIVDNFSTDDTAEVVRQYKDERIRYYQFANNGIIAASRNYGVSLAHGEYVAFLDSDDLWEKDKLIKQVFILNNEPQTALVTSLYQVISDNPRFNNQVLGPRHSSSLRCTFGVLLDRNFILTSSCLMRKNVCQQQGGFNEKPEFRCVEDYDLWLRVAYQHDIAYVNEVLVYYREHGANTSRSGEVLKKACLIFDEQFQNARVSAKLVKKLKAVNYIREGFHIIETDPKLSRQYFFKAWQLARVNVRVSLKVGMGLVFSIVPKLYVQLVTTFKK